MKQFATYFLLSLLLVVFGCSDNSLLNEPVQNSVSRQIVKLPAADNSSVVQKAASFSKDINGDEGGDLWFRNKYYTSDGEKVSVRGHLSIPAGAFDYTTTITVIIEDDLAAVQFYPSPTTFDKPLILDLDYEGLNLDNNAEAADFYFISDDQSQFELINKQSKEINVSEGTLKVNGAELEHFSRFGWAI